MFAAIDITVVTSAISSALGNAETVLIAGLGVVALFYGFKIIKKALSNAK